MSTDYAKKKNAELEDLLKARGLPHTGKKAELVARLLESDNIQSSIASNEPPSNVEQAAVKEQLAKSSGSSSDKPPTSAINDPFDANPKPNTQVQIGKKPVAQETKGEDAPLPAIVQAALPKSATSTSTTEQGVEGVKAEEPKKDFSSHLASTDVENEIAARKRRAERFGITSSVTTDGAGEGEGTTGAKENVESDAAKLEERAKRFGLSVEETSSLATRLDSALPSERERKGRKRGRGEEGKDGREGKRVASVAAKKAVNGGGEGGKKVESEQMKADREAAERRKARFAVTA